MSRLLDPGNFVAEKLAWHQWIANDPTISLPAKAVAGFVLHDLNASQGGAWRGQESMSASLGVSGRQLRRLLGELQSASYLSIEVRKGRGRTNLCIATFPDDVPATSENRTPTTAVRSERRTSESGQTPENRTCASRKPDMGDRQFLYDPIKKLPPRAGRSTYRPGTAMRFRCPDIRQLVVSLAGEAATISYLDAASWDPVARRIICKSDTATARLGTLAGKRLAQMGITVARQPVSAFEIRIAA